MNTVWSNILKVVEVQSDSWCYDGNDSVEPFAFFQLPLEEFFALVPLPLEEFLQLPLEELEAPCSFSHLLLLHALPHR